MKRRWIDPSTYPCPERKGCKDIYCLGRECTRWDKANDCCIRYPVGWIYEFEDEAEEERAAPEFGLFHHQTELVRRCRG